MRRVRVFVDLGLAVIQPQAIRSPSYKGEPHSSFRRNCSSAKIPYPNPPDNVTSPAVARLATEPFISLDENMSWASKVLWLFAVRHGSPRPKDISLVRADFLPDLVGMKVSFPFHL